MPPLPRSIALHIGAHKTASSHLQNVLYRNREMLSGEGVRVYGPGYLRMPGRNLAAMFGLSWSESPSPRRSPQDQIKFLSKGRKRLVFSEENFVGNLIDSRGRTTHPLYPSGPARVAELVEKLAPLDVRLFVALRNPASFMASTYSQALFGGAYLGPRAFRNRNNWQDIDWAAYVAALRAIPGLGDMYVWRQEDYEQSQRMILRRLLGWRVGPKIETVEGRVHQGLSSNAVRQTLEWAHEGREGPLARDARAKYPVTSVAHAPMNKPFQLYAAATYAEAADIYAAQMTQIEGMEGVTVLQPSTTPQEG